jgi:hypothetical protein
VVETAIEPNTKNYQRLTGDNNHMTEPL